MSVRKPLSILLLATACGCSTLTTAANKVNPWHQEPLRATAKNPVVEVACIWQPGEGRNDKGIPCRGFSGQVFFFTRKESEPALVDGKVRVYLFSDRGSEADRSKPLHQYDFSPEAWGLHATMTSLGPGYSVFVPYPDADPYQARCQLRLRFEPAGGGTLYSESVTLTLDGRPRPAATGPGLTPTVQHAEIDRRTGTLRQIGEQAADAPRKLKTATFALDGRGSLMPVGYEEPANDPAARRKADRHPLTGKTVHADGLHPLTAVEPGAEPGAAKDAGEAAHPLTAHPAANAPRELPDAAATPSEPEERFRLSRPASRESAGAESTPQPVRLAPLLESASTEEDR